MKLSSALDLKRHFSSFHLSKKKKKRKKKRKKILNDCFTGNLGEIIYKAESPFFQNAFAKCLGERTGASV